MERWRPPERFMAATASGSAHLVDLRAGTDRRLSISHELRGDATTLHLVACSRPLLGRPLTLLLDGLASPDNYTWRTTSDIVEVEHL